MLTEIPLESYAAALDRCAEDALWETNTDQPPVDAFRLAARLGLRITTNRLQRERARFVRVDPRRGRGVIVVGPEDRPERRHWAVAHEVGESISHRVFAVLGVDPGDAPPLERERVANSLAGRFLAPSRWLRGVARACDDDLAELKATFVTASHELLVRRLLECRSDPMLATVFDNNRITWRRWNLPRVAPPVTEAERSAQAAAHQTGLPTRVAGRAPLDRGRCWPIHEPDWRREIILAYPPAWAD